MKKKLLFLFCSIFISSLATAQIIHTDDFQDATVQGWVIALFGASPPNPPANISTGGPSGVGDNFLSYTTITPPPTAGSRLVIINQNSNWARNYTADGIIEIRFNVKVTTNDLNLRVALDGGGGRIGTTNSVLVTAGSGWQTVSIPVRPTDMQLLSGGSDISATLAAVTEIRILSNTSPDHRGEIIIATLDIDNIQASASILSSKDDKLVNAFSISPNPGRDKLNLKLSMGLNLLKKSILMYHIITLRNIRFNQNLAHWSAPSGSKICA